MKKLLSGILFAVGTLIMRSSRYDDPGWLLILLASELAGK